MCIESMNPSFKKMNSLRRLDLLRCESEELLSKSTLGTPFSLNFVIISIVRFILALNRLTQDQEDIEELDENEEDEDENCESGPSSYHSSASQANNNTADHHQMILAKSLSELQDKLSRMEQELSIVGEESKELHVRLSHREEDLNQKVNQIRILDFTSFLSLCSESGIARFGGRGRTHATAEHQDNRAAREAKSEDGGHDLQIRGHQARPPHLAG